MSCERCTRHSSMPWPQRLDDVRRRMAGAEAAGLLGPGRLGGGCSSDLLAVTEPKEPNELRTGTGIRSR